MSRIRKEANLPTEIEHLTTEISQDSTTSDDDAWEDLIKPKPSPLKAANGRSSSPTASIRSQSRRRRSAGKTVFVSVFPRKQYNAPSPTKPRRKRSPSPISKPDSPEIWREKWIQEVFLWTMQAMKYVWGVLSTSLWLLKKPLSFILFLFLLATIISRVNQTLRTAFAPLCFIPGISNLALCRSSPTHHDHRPPQWADYPKLVDVQSATFEQLLDESVGGKGLALEIKKAEMATVDLNTLVRVSNLKSRDMIAQSLTNFVEDAKRTGRGLQKLNSKVGGAVDGHVLLASQTI